MTVAQRLPVFWAGIDPQARLTRTTGLLAGCLTILVAGLCLWEYRHDRATAIQMAMIDCRSSFNKDLVYRRWASGHGGVYVPVTDKTPPNPYLGHIAERDITTPSGRQLTLVNPAYMTRQVHELAKEQYGTQGHITSLNALRPENAPDPWEATALRRIAAGEDEVSALEMIGKEPYVRLMRPMLTESGCLKCHGHQGYQVGEVRGGISVSVPISPFLTVQHSDNFSVYFGFGLLWATGMAGLWFAMHKIQRALFIRLQADKALADSEALYHDLVETSQDLIWQCDAEGRYVYLNPAWEAVFGYPLAKMLGRKFTDFQTPEAARRDQGEFSRLLEGNMITGLETTHIGKDGRVIHLLFNAKFVTDGQGRMIGTRGTAFDITARKKDREEILRALREKEVLLKEIHHRVKNNMQVIHSLLNLQSKGVAEPAVRAMFEESRNRVISMALIHEKLYRSKDLAFIDFKEYLKSLTAGIADTYHRPDIVVTVDMAELSLDVNVGIPCGLIVNELVSNCLKHAFPAGREGRVTVGINRNRAGDHVLTVVDNGIGFPDELDCKNTTSLGLQLVNVLSGQLHGSLELVRQEGTMFRLTFPGPDH